MTQWQRMVRGLLYQPSDPELKELRKQAQQKLQQFNRLPIFKSDARQSLIRTIFGATEDNCSVYPPFFCDYGINIFVGMHFFANIGCTVLDVAPVHIGDNVMLGPGVIITTASHPIDPTLRASGYGLGMPIFIGDNVWIGAGAILNPGITIGNNSVIGSGSVVTHDIPDNVVAAGNPCQVLHLIA